MAKRVFPTKSLNGSNEYVGEYPVNASQTIAVGDVVVLATGKVSVAAAAAAAGTVLGVARTAITTGGTVDADDTILVETNPEMIYSMPYEGSTKTSLTKEDIGTSFDLGSDAQTVNLDDTTDGYFLCLGFDNDEDRIKALIQNRVQNV